MGYIKLACQVTNVWYLKHLPSYIANLLSKIFVYVGRPLKFGST